MRDPGRVVHDQAQRDRDQRADQRRSPRSASSAARARSRPRAGRIPRIRSCLQRLQLVAEAADRLDAVLADLAAQPLHVDVHDPGVAAPAVVPHPLQQPVAGEDGAGRGRRTPAAAASRSASARPAHRPCAPPCPPGRPPGRRRQHPARGLVGCLLAAAAAAAGVAEAAQHRPDPGDQHGAVEGLGDVVVGARPPGPARRRSSRRAPTA